MKNLIIYFLLGLLTNIIVNASRGDFYDKNDNRSKLFKILDDHIGTIKITLDKDEWTTMKNMTVLDPLTASEAPKYSTNKASMEFIVEGTDYKAKYEPEQFTFELGGSGSRSYSKPGYNIKFENEKDALYEVKSLRIRSSVRDPTLIREKLGSDMLYKMDITITSAAYIRKPTNKNPTMLIQKKTINLLMMNILYIPMKKVILLLIKIIGLKKLVIHAVHLVVKFMILMKMVIGVMKMTISVVFLKDIVTIKDIVIINFNFFLFY